MATGNTGVPRLFLVALLTAVWLSKGCVTRFAQGWGGGGGKKLPEASLIVIRFTSMDLNSPQTSTTVP